MPRTVPLGGRPLPRAGRKSRPGRALETLVAVLERALGAQQDIIVESPAFMADRITGERREHDVVVTATAGHHKTVIAIECRQRSRKVTVNDVEGFKMKCDDTRVSAGVMVSVNGFTAAARTKAEHNGIRLLTLVQAAEFPWNLARGIEVKQRNILHTNILVLQSQVSGLSGSAITVYQGGQMLPVEQLGAAARAEFEKLPATQMPDGPGKQVIIFEAPDGITVCDDTTGQHYPVVKVEATLEYEIKSEFVPFELMQYHDESQGEIASAAVAPFETMGMKGRVVFLKKPDQGIQVMVLRD